jgi:hypothetical protein
MKRPFSALSKFVMNRKVQQRLKRIEKNEEKERKILMNQRKELTKAMQETEKCIQQVSHLV